MSLHVYKLQQLSFILQVFYSHYYYVRLCINGSYMEMKKTWFPYQRTYRLVGETDKKSKISLDCCKALQERKCFRDSNISSKAITP